MKLVDIANRLPATPETVRRAERRATRGAALIGAGLHWRRIGSGWRLFDGRRRFGEIVPDSTYPNMWRPVLTGGRHGDMANITWAKHAVLEAAVRELEWEDRRNPATDPSKCPEKRGVSEGARPHSRSHAREATYPAPTRWSGRHEPPRQQVDRARRAGTQGTSAPGSATTPAAGTYGPVARSDRHPSMPLAPIVESALPDWRDRESIRAEFEAREAAGGRPSKRPAVRGSATRARDAMNGRDAVLDLGPAQGTIMWIAGDCDCADALN